MVLPFCHFPSRSPPFLVVAASISINIVAPSRKSNFEKWKNHTELSSFLLQPPVIMQERQTFHHPFGPSERKEKNGKERKKEREKEKKKK